MDWWKGPCYHLFVVQVQNRKKIIKKLNENNISSMIHYPFHALDQKCYNKHYKNQFPNSKTLSNIVLSLPIYPQLKETDIYYVSEIINSI